MACWWYFRHSYKKWITYQIGGLWFVQAGGMLYEIVDDQLNWLTGDPL